MQNIHNIGLSKTTINLSNNTYKPSIPLCNETINKTNCYHDLNGKDWLQIEILYHDFFCNLTDTEFKQLVNVHNNQSNILFKSLANSINQNSIHHEYLNKGCYNYKRALYAKNTFDNAVIREINNKSYFYQIGFYLIKGNIIIHNFILDIMKFLCISGTFFFLEKLSELYLLIVDSIY